MLEINNICRICLKEEDPKLPIFTEDEGKSKSKLTLPEKIMSFAKVQVSVRYAKPVKTEDTGQILFFLKQDEKQGVQLLARI